MSEPRMADTKPAEVELAPGRYSWCTCGESANQPFCDHAHRAAGEFRSLKFEVHETTRVLLCQCKRTSTPPFCDGTHETL